VGGIHFRVTDNDLRSFFRERWGSVTDCKIIMDKEKKKSKGYGFVTFASIDVAERVKSRGTIFFQGKHMNVSAAVRRAEKEGPKKIGSLLSSSTSSTPMGIAKSSHKSNSRSASSALSVGVTGNVWANQGGTTAVAALGKKSAGMHSNLTLVGGTSAAARLANAPSTANGQEKNPSDAFKETGFPFQTKALDVPVVRRRANSNGNCVGAARGLCTEGRLLRGGRRTGRQQHDKKRSNWCGVDAAPLAGGAGLSRSDTRYDYSAVSLPVPVRLPTPSRAHCRTAAPLSGTNIGTAAVTVTAGGQRPVDALARAARCRARGLYDVQPRLVPLPSLPLESWWLPH